MSGADVTRLRMMLADGRTDVVMDLLAAGVPAEAKDESGVSLIQHCAYYGDVTAMKVLLANDAMLGRIDI